MTYTNDLEVLSYHTLSIRTHENVQIQDSTSGHPGESRSWLQTHLYIRKKTFSTNKYPPYVWKNKTCRSDAVCD